MLLHSKQSHKSTLLPSKGHVATVYVDRHWHCTFPRHLDPLKIGKRLSESMLPLCSGIKDYLCITRRTGNTALLRDHVPIDFIEKYAPKGAYPRMPCAAKDVCVPPVVMPRSLPISKEAEHGASAACLSPTSVVSEVYLHLHAPGAVTPLPGPYSVDVHTAGQSDTENCAGSLSHALDSYTFMAPAYLELLPEGDTVPLGPPHQLLLDGAVLDAREAELPVDTGPLGPPHQLLMDGAVLDTREAELPVDTGPLGPPHQLLMDGAVLDAREAELPVDTGPLGPPHQLLLDGAVLDAREAELPVDTGPLGPPHQLLMDGAVLDAREAQLPVDTGAGTIPCMNTEQEESDHTVATLDRPTSSFQEINETLAVDTSGQ